MRMAECQLPRTPDLKGTDTTRSFCSTNLCLTDKNDFFNSILTSLTHSITQQSSCLTDLDLLCSGPDGPLVVSVHGAVLASQSPLLQDLLLSATGPILLLPEVKVKTVWNMLDLLYTGRCDLREENVPSVVQLLTSLGLHGVVRTLEQTDGKCPEESGFLARSSLACLTSLGLHAVLGFDREVSSPDNPASGVEVERQTVDYTLPKGKINRKRGRKNVVHTKIIGLQVPEDGANNEPSSTIDGNTSTMKKLYPERYCQMCGKKERNLYTLKVHYTNSHFFAEVAALIKDKKSSQCELCGQHFADGYNQHLNIVRHRGATHKEVIKFVQKECGSGDGIVYDHCKICDVRREDWNSESLGHHLIQKHYEVLELKNLLSPGQDVCNICDSKSENIYGMIAHIGLTHGFAIKLYRDFIASKSFDRLKVKTRKSSLSKSKTITCPNIPPNGPKVSKKCHLCHLDIAGSGKFWRYPLYSHFARIHFGKDLVRDFRTVDNKCSVCGVAEDFVGERRFLVHLGAKHRLVEKYVEKSLLLAFAETEDSGTVAVNNDEEQTVQNFPEKDVMQSRKSALDQQGEDSLHGELVMLKEQLTLPLIGEEQDEEQHSSPVANESQNIPSEKTPVLSVTCPHCYRRLQETSLQTHLVSRHFKKDCEEAIKTVLQTTGGKCPKCSAQFKLSQYSGLVDWRVHIHFARTHKIAEDLDPTAGKDECNQANVEKIERKLYP